MADAATVQVLIDGPRNAVIQLKSISDSTGETAVTKVDVSALSGAPPQVAVDRIEYTTSGMSVHLHWDQLVDAQLWSLPADDTGCLDFRRMGGLQNPRGEGSSGDIALSTTGASNGDAYNILLHLHKKWTPVPRITSAAAVNNEEDTALAHALTSNLDPHVTWAITGGVDAAQFELAGSILTWVGDGVQDYETPADDGTDNAYVVEVTATEPKRGLTAVQTITVTVTDVAE